MSQKISHIKVEIGVKNFNDLLGFRELGPSFASVVASVIAVTSSTVASERSKLGSFAVGRGLRLRCLLHRQ